jgi:hypothetical protein
LIDSKFHSKSKPSKNRAYVYTTRIMYCRFSQNLSQQNLSSDNLVHDGLRGVGVVQLGPRRAAAGASIRTETAGAPFGPGVVAGRGGGRRRRLGLRWLVVHARRLRAVRVEPRRDAHAHVQHLRVPRHLDRCLLCRRPPRTLCSVGSAWGHEEGRRIRGPAIYLAGRRARREELLVLAVRLGGASCFAWLSCGSGFPRGEELTIKTCPSALGSGWLPFPCVGCWRAS